MYAVLVGAAFLLLVGCAAAGRPLALLGLAAAAVAVRPARTVLAGAAGRDLIAVLGDTGKVQLAYGALVTLGVVLSA